MSTFSAYCLNCGEVIRRVEHEEVAFCTLACQTRALLTVAEVQASLQEQEQEQGRDHLFGEPEDGSNPDRSTSGKGTSTEQRRPPGGGSSLYNRPAPSAAARAAGGGTTSPAPAPSKLTTAATEHSKFPSRPPLQTRYSLAIVNNLVTPSSPSHSNSLQHPIMASLRSDIFSVSSVVHPHAPRSFGGGAPRTSFEGTTIPQTAARIASTASQHASSAHTTQPSFFSSPLSPLNAELDPSQPSAEAMYRQHYPKFVSRRHQREHSPNKPPRTSDSHSPSITMEGQLLTPPPSVIRPQLVLPELHSTNTGRNPPPPTPSSSLQVVVNGAPSMDTAHFAQPTLASPLLRHTPERRSAPRRSLDISPSISQQSEPNVPLSNGNEIAGQIHPPPPFSEIPKILRPGLRTHGSTGSGRGRSDTSLANGNSLGLDIQHVESVRSPPHSSSSTPPVEIDENIEPSSDRYLAVGKAKLSIPVSPPKLRSRLISMHTAPAGAARRELAGSDGWRSVEASRYTLGPREASYIVRKLSEEQKKRQQKERAAAKEEVLEARGRSRVRKRAGSWGNSLALAQSMTCESRGFC